MNFLERGPAHLSACRTWRYTLERTWREGEQPYVAWVGLNPSTADEQQLDPTLRRVFGFSTRWGFGKFVMLNLFAYRATQPRAMRVAADPVGPENDWHIAQVARDASLVVAAWGTHGTLNDRDREVFEILKLAGTPIGCLGVTKDGHPKHPLYIASKTPWRPFTCR